MAAAALYKGKDPPAPAGSWCPTCHGFIRRRRVGTDGGDVITVCNCRSPVLACWRELLAVQERAMQAPRRRLSGGGP